MSLLNILYRPFPRVLSSPSAQSSRPSASTTSIATTQAHPLAGVSQAEWLIQPQTQNPEKEGANNRIHAKCAKFQPRLEKGVFLGKTEESDEHIVAVMMDDGSQYV